ncbi:bifunctional DNA-formamidopyrimidine glycosylase/DNA-(apurinic or apyrimidinic site) lyase [Candidatus Peregrinibacteria bacterium]|nr:MAG: bifunctional DNA-formamidopyrimidine glycosylase/DNA-(apurinic or apyrimidinic site) lyase [Candidatus Peregrinibacteria bacterium]
MPELAEVQTIVSDLHHLVGYTFKSIQTDWPKALSPSLSAFQKNLIGKKIIAVHRRAKYIAIELSDDWILLIHLRMSGRLFIREKGHKADTHVHVCFEFDRNKELRFSDQRKFGRAWMLKKSDYKTLPEIKKLGQEPLDPNFTVDDFKARFRSKKGKLKAKLLDQTLLAGIGNIYADEISFAAGLHPQSSLENLSESDLENLYHEMRRILEYAVQARGSSVGEFMDAFGNIGSAQKMHYAYGRKGLPCKVCGTTLHGIKVAQRGTSFCPKCQELK